MPERLVRIGVSRALGHNRLDGQIGMHLDTLGRAGVRPYYELYADRLAAIGEKPFVRLGHA
ncbi:hypothetical protein [Gluconobacter oxydans]|uniref:hypothetical protein n=1 Tax=Gluconobacter oxydans TaxID=442 RepID=UPI0039E8EFFA